MANEQLVNEVLAKVMGKVDGAAPEAANIRPSATEFVCYNPVGDTIGLVIANVDENLLPHMRLAKKYKSIGIMGARTGAGPHIFAADEAVKATNTEIVMIELPRDTKGGGGHGSLIIFGADDVSDARRAVEIAVKDVTRTFGDVYANDAGHLEFQYTARASYALNYAFGAPVGKSFGITVATPAAIGVVLADTAIKAANVEVVGYASPKEGTSFSNEVIGFFTGDSGAVRQAIRAARDMGMGLLGAMGAVPQTSTTPYI
jgi:microcompartment protein PduB